MLSKTLGVLDLTELITNIHYHSSDSIDSVKRPAVLLLASPITAGTLPVHQRFLTLNQIIQFVLRRLAPGQRFRRKHQTRLFDRR